MTQAVPAPDPGHATAAEPRSEAGHEPSLKEFLLSGPDLSALELDRPRNPMPAFDVDLDVHLHWHTVNDPERRADVIESAHDHASVCCSLVLRSRQTRQHETEARMARRQPDEHDGHEPRWQLQEAKQRFSELVRAAENDGPQIVTRHDEGTVVVMNLAKYRRLTGAEPDFKEFLMNAPDFSLLDLPSRESARPIDLDLES